MKMKVRMAIFIAAIAFPSVLSAQYPQLRSLSSDTLLVGESNEHIMVNPGVTPGATIFSLLQPDGYFGCHSDTIIASSVVSDTSVITAVFDLPVGICIGTYRLVLYDDHNVFGEQTLWIHSKPFVSTSPQDTIVCNGEGVSIDIDAYKNESVWYWWYHGETLVTSNDNGILELSSVQAADTGWYHCILYNYFGTDSAGFRLSIHPYQENVGRPEGPASLCMNEGTSAYSLPEDPLIDTYAWVVQPAEAGSIIQDGRSAQVQWDPDYAGEAMIFAGTGLGECTGPNSDSLKVQLVGPAEVPEICIVGVDEATGKYRIVWNKMDNGSIIAYNIYRESNQAGVFLPFHNAGPDDFSVVVDSTSIPDILPHSYRISYSDTCGNESEFSPLHRTIHLSANLGTGGENNLNWTTYEGFAFLSYDIYRGTHKDSMVLMQQVPSSINAMTDQSPPSNRVFYQVAVSRDGACQPAKKGSVDYSVSRSNVVEINTVGMKEHRSGLLTIYPNPARGHIMISTDEPVSLGTLSIFDLTGKVIGACEVNTQPFRFSTESMPTGMYFLKLESGAKSYHGRFAVE